MVIALQDLCLPEGTCYGCGSANPDGLHLKSYWSADGQMVVAQFEPQAKFTSGFKGALYGGLIASHEISETPSRASGNAPELAEPPWRSPRRCAALGFATNWAADRSPIRCLLAICWHWSMPSLTL